MSPWALGGIQSAQNWFPDPPCDGLFGFPKAARTQQPTYLQLTGASGAAGEPSELRLDTQSGGQWPNRIRLGLEQQRRSLNDLLVIEQILGEE